MGKLIDFGSNLFAAIGGEVVGVNMLKNIIAKAIAHKAVGPAIGKAVTGGASPSSGQQESESQTPEIRFGGVFDLSDEIAFGTLIARMRSHRSLVGAAVKVSKFLNDSNRFSPGQRRRFRAVVGSISRTEYTIRVNKAQTTTQQGPGKPPIVKDETTEVKTNDGIEFMKSFATYSEADMMDVCRAMGIHDSIIDNVSDGLAHLGRHVAKIAEAIEQSPAAQTVMTGLLARIKADRARIAAKKATHTP